jgi:hypothetical protein
MSKPGQATLLWLHFGITASALIKSFGGFLPLPFGTSAVLVESANLVAAELAKKEKDQEDSMKNE